MSIKYHLVKNPMTYHNLISIVEEVSIPAGHGFLKRYQHAPLALNIRELQPHDPETGPGQLLKQLGGWGPTIYHWAQHHYNCANQNSDTILFNEEAKAQLILIAFIWAADWYWKHSQPTYDIGGNKIREVSRPEKKR